MSSRIASGSCSSEPAALEPSGAFGLACRSRRTRRLDRVGRSTEFVCGDMRDHRGLAGSECRDALDVALPADADLSPNVGDVDDPWLLV
jgi:hypothetical protein